MTANQINFMNALETKRHQLATETQAQNELAETQTHNRATELNANQTLSEVNRHNLATESSTRYANKEQKRHNKATEKETAKHNRKTESQGDTDLAERGRHNLATESLSSQDIAAKIYAADRSANAAITSASINAEAHKAAANISADASKYVARVNADATKYSADVSKYTQQWKTTAETRSREQIAAEDREFRKTQQQLDRMVEVVKNNNINAIEKQKLELERQRLNIDKMYKRGQITLQAADTMRKAIDDIIRNSTNAANQLLKGGKR